jgi:hypothetical protein
MSASDQSRKINIKEYSAAMTLAAFIVFVFYFLTCFRTITWWDSSEYSLAALTFGVPHPPGSLISVLLGWLFSKMPFGIDKFFELNLLAALIAAATVYLVGRIAYHLNTLLSGNNNAIGSGQYFIIGTALGALLYGVSLTTWYYSVRFTPYIMTVLFTALIISAFLAWYRYNEDINSHLYFALTILLFGLDFSVHRTNLLMLPGFLICVLIINRRTFLSVKHWITGAIALIIGFAFQLLIIPIAASNPFLNVNNPSSLKRFWDYTTLKQYGGGWLINIYPRKAPFWNIQISDYLKIFGDNFASSSFLILGYLPLIFGIIGLILILRRNWKLGLSLVVLFLFSSLGAILYFNLPQNYFRSIDRHYMPSFLLFAVFISYGAGVILKTTISFSKRYQAVISIIILLFITLMPIQAIFRNYHKVDGSKSLFTFDTAKNFLTNLPQDAILFTQADIDTYPLWALQAVDGIRRDITVCNLGLTNTPWYISQIMRQDSRYPLRLSSSEIERLTPIPWHDSTMSLLVIKNADNYGLPHETVLPDSISFTVSPTIQNQYILIQDQFLLKTIQANEWKRPICLSNMLPDSNIKWLRPYLRPEGLYWRMVPVRSEKTEIEILQNALFSNYNYQGYIDNTISKDEPTKWVAWNYCSSFLALASMKYSSGDTLGCNQVIAKLHSFIDPSQLSVPKELNTALNDACKQ